MPSCKENPQESVGGTPHGTQSEYIPNYSLRWLSFKPVVVHSLNLDGRYRDHVPQKTQTCKGERFHQQGGKPAVACPFPPLEANPHDHESVHRRFG